MWSELEFEWDEDKAESNLAKHGVSFDAAASIFRGPTIQKIDARKDYGEVRHIAYGISRGKVIRVVYTWRNENCIRIISAWKADKHDREKYCEIYTQ